jgi:Leucine Rich repeat
MLLNSSESLDDNAVEQRWFAIIQRLQTLITHALAQSQVSQALRLWRALQTAMQAVVDNRELPPLAFGQLLQKSFLLTLASHVDRGTLKVIESWFSHALKLPELAEHLAELKFTQAELYNLHLKAPTQCIATQPFDLSTLVENHQTRCAALSGYACAYLSALRADQSMLQTDALRRIKESEIAFLNALSTTAWDAYAYLEDNTQKASSSALVTTASETHCSALKWLVTLTEQQHILSVPRESVLPTYRERLIQLRQIYQAAVTTIPTAAVAHLEMSESLINAQRAFSCGVRQLLAQIICDGEAILGPAPCTYTFIGFGSLSRDEMLPFSDLECGLFVPSDLAPAQGRLAHAYLLALWQWFTFSLQSLAESGENSERLGIHLDHQLCPKVTSRGLEGCYGTPEQIFFDHLASSQDLGFAQAYSFMKPVYITGRTRNDGWNGFTLLHEYYRALTVRIQQLQNTPSTVQHAIAWAQLPEHQQEWQELLRRPLTPTTAIQIKADYTTPLLCLIYDLALYHDVDIRNALPPITTMQGQINEQVTNTYDIITTLVEQKHLSPVFGQALRHAYTFLMYLRLNAQYHYQQQLELAVLPEAANSALETFYAEDPRLSQQLAMVFTKPTSANLYRLTPQAHAHLQRIRVFIFEPVLGLLKFHEQARASQQSLPWYDPLQTQLETLLANRLQQESPEALTTWVQLLTEHLLENKADSAAHLHCYRILTALNTPEVLRTTYLEALLPTPLMTDLSTLPRRDGYRQTERLSYGILTSALRAIGLTVPETSVLATAELTVMLYSPSAGRRRLHKNVVAQLIDPATGDIKPFDPQTKNLHRVGRVCYSDHTLHVKQRPNHPGMDYAIDLLHRRLIGHGTTANELAVLTVISSHYHRRYPALLSTTVPGPTLAAVMQQPHWDTKSLTELCLVAILTLPGDGASRNFIVKSTPENTHTLVSIDSDVAFVEPVVKIGGLLGQHKLQVATVLLAMPEVMHQPFVRDTLDAVCQWDAEALLTHWLEAVETREAQYEALFQEPEMQQLYQGDANNPFTPSLLFRQGTLALLAFNLRYMQGLCRAALQTNQPLTPWQLLQKLQPCVAKYYQPALAKINLNPDQRVEKAIQTVRGSLTSCQSLTASLGKVPALEDIAAKTLYSPTAAKQELAVLKLEQFANTTVFIHQHDTASQQWRIRADFTTLDKQPDAAIRQRFILQALIGRSYQELILVGCTELDDDLLKGLISDSPDLQILRLRHCPKLTQHSIDYLAAHCPQLVTLELTGITLEKLASYLGTVTFPHLVTLYVIDANQLRFIQLQVPNLETFSLQRAPAMGRIKRYTSASPKSFLAASQLKVVHFSHCPTLTETWLMAFLQDCDHLQQLTLTACPQVLYRELKETAPQLARAVLAEVPSMIPYLEAIAHNRTDKLDLSGTSLVEKHLTAIKLAMCHNTSITELNLEQALANEQIQLLTRLLQSHQKIQTLKLARNHLTNENLALLLVALQTPYPLQMLDLSYNEISAKGVAQLATWLENHPSLTHLDLTGNDIRDESALRLAKALKNNRQLTKLVLSGSLIDPDIRALFEQILARNRTPPSSPKPVAFWQPASSTPTEDHQSPPPPLPSGPSLPEGPRH